MEELLFGSIFLVLIISGIFSFFEIAFIRIFFEIKSTKYIVLLRILETMTPFVTLVIASGPRAILKSVFPVFCSLCFLYIIILIIEIFRKKINMKELVVNSVLCFIDVALVVIGLIIIFGF